MKLKQKKLDWENRNFFYSYNKNGCMSYNAINIIFETVTKFIIALTKRHTDTQKTNKKKTQFYK